MKESKVKDRLCLNHIKTIVIKSMKFDE